MKYKVTVPSGSRGGVRRAARVVVANTVVYVGAVVCLGPLLWTVSTALKPEAAALTSKFFFGYRLHFNNFVEAWNFFPFGRYLLNSLVMSVGGVVVVLVASTTGGYAFGRLRFSGRDKIFRLYVLTLLIPASAVVVPLFLIVRFLHIYNSYLGLILPLSFSAFGTFLMVQFFRSLPRELSDAAKVDGASELRTFLSVLLPLVRPAAAVLAVFTFIGDWGNFIWPLVATQSSNLSTLTLGLSSFQGEYGSFWSYLMAGSLIAIMPTVLLVILLQRYLVRGLAFVGFGGR